MQVAGFGYKIRYSDVKAAFLDSKEFHTRILEVTQQRTLTTLRLAASNKLHGNNARLARWLLMKCYLGGKPGFISH